VTCREQGGVYEKQIQGSFSLVAWHPGQSAPPRRLPHSSFFIPHRSPLDQKVVNHVRTAHHGSCEWKRVGSLVYAMFPQPMQFVSSLRANTMQQITSSCPCHRLNNLNKLTNSRSPIAQYIYHVRSWRRDVVVRWTGHGQVLTRSTRCPTCHIQLDHPVAHMDGVSNESTEEYQYNAPQCSRIRWNNESRQFKANNDVTYP
jgi:hypothetical protein